MTTLGRDGDSVGVLTSSKFNSLSFLLFCKCWSSAFRSLNISKQHSQWTGCFASKCCSSACLSMNFLLQTLQSNGLPCIVPRISSTRLVFNTNQQLLYLSRFFFLVSFQVWFFNLISCFTNNCTLQSRFSIQLLFNPAFNCNSIVIQSPFNRVYIQLLLPVHLHFNLLIRIPSTMKCHWHVQGFSVISVSFFFSECHRIGRYDTSFFTETRQNSREKSVSGGS